MFVNVHNSYIHLFLSELYFVIFNTSIYLHELWSVLVERSWTGLVHWRLQMILEAHDKYSERDQIVHKDSPNMCEQNKQYNNIIICTSIYKYNFYNIICMHEWMIK